MTRLPSQLMFLPVLGFTLSLLSCAQAQDNRLFNKLVGETRQSIQEKLKEYQIPGAAVAVFDQEKTLWLECFGVRDASSGLPVTPRTTFSIQSISKTVTATAIMLAVQDGRLDLDTAITEYLPEFTVNSAFEEAAEQKITVRCLLNHTAGFTGEAAGGNNAITGFLPFNEYVKSIGQTWLVSPVGAKYYYSNISIDLAGNALQNASKRPFAQVIQQDLFQSLGMSRSFVDTLKINGSADNVSKGHGPDYTRLPEYLPISASGGVRMSIEDAVRFIQFHLNRGRINGRELLRPELLDQMYARSVRIFKGGDSVWYGLGVHSWPEAGTYALAHHGAGFGFRCVFKWYPEYGIGVVMMANGFDEDFTEWEATRYVLREMVNRRIVTKRKEVGVVSAERFLANQPDPFVSDQSSVPSLEPTPYRPEWKQFLGRYRMIFGGGVELTPDAEDEEPDVFVVEKDGYLVFCREDVEERLYEHDPGLFFMEHLREALDLRKSPPTLANLALEKIE